MRVLANGVNLKAFEHARGNAAAVPDDLALIPQPRLGYVGSLHPQVDYALVARLAKARPAWHIVFVGGKGSESERLAVAADNTWDERVAAFDEWLTAVAASVQ